MPRCGTNSRTSSTSNLSARKIYPSEPELGRSLSGIAAWLTTNLTHEKEIFWEPPFKCEELISEYEINSPDTSIPDGLFCPILRGLFDNPVVAADGVTCDKAPRLRMSVVSRMFFVKQVKCENFSCLSFEFNFVFKRFVLQA